MFWLLQAKIKKVTEDGKTKYRVVSESGKNLGTYSTEAEAKKRLQQVEYFKHKNNP